jgi:predicted transcriptional regulator
MDDIASRSLSEKVVVLCLADLGSAGETPAHTARVVRASREHLDAVEEETLGKLPEAAVNRALNRLEADGIVTMVDADDRSPAGKGRPEYALAVGTDAVVDALAEDDQVGTLAAQVAGT